MQNMISVDEAIKDVEIAFQQVEYSLKANAYWASDTFDVNQYSTDLMVQLNEGNLHFPSRTFVKKDEVLAASEVAISLAYGATALTLDQALETAGYKVNPKSDDDFDQLRCVAYLVRCAYAHRIAQPYWDVHADKQRVYRYFLAGREISVDAKHLNGKDFDFAHIGGHVAWHDLKTLILARINTQQMEKK